MHADTLPERIWLDAGMQPWRVWTIQMSHLPEYIRALTADAGAPAAPGTDINGVTEFGHYHYDKTAPTGPSLTADAGAQATTITEVVDMGRADHSRRVYEDGKQVWPDAGAQREADPYRAEGSTQSTPRMKPGLYRVYWASGGHSDVAVGCSYSGDNWVAPTNWIAPAMVRELTQWADVRRIEPVAPPADPVREAARVLLADLLNREEDDVFEVAQDALDAGEDGPGVLFAALRALAALEDGQ